MQASFLLIFVFISTLTGTSGGLFRRIFGVRSRDRQGGRRDRDLPFTGLVNLGNTCYMNSLLQSLYFVGTFKEAVLSAAYAEGSAGAELQQIFRDLGDTDNRRPVNTVGLARTLGLDVNIQEDSQEFYLKLMNRLKDGLGSNSFNPAEVFQGEYTQIIACPEKEFSKSKVQKFKDISADVYGHTSLSVSLKELFQPETLSGYIVPDHGEQEVEKKISIRKLPKALCVHLKRFEFNMQHSRMTKIGQFMEFPTSLNMSQYKDSTPQSQSQTQLSGVERDRSIGSYRLSAIVIHDGTSNVGHYTCIARPRGKEQEKWVLLNDRIVQETNMAEIMQMAYGGYEKQLGQDFTSKNAYLLFYEATT